MINFAIDVYTRGNDKVLLPAGVTFAAQSWDASAVGGSSSAQINATGSIERLLDLANWLGYSLWIISPDNEYVWSGDIVEVAFQHAGSNVGVTLADVANKIKVLYTDDAPGGEMESAETTWVFDADSMALYGRRERQHTAQNPIRAAQAEQMRDTLLARVSRPFATVGQMGQDTGESQATIYCNGWWTRLESLYYAQDNGRTEYVTGSYRQPLGMGFTGTTVAGSSRDKHFLLHDISGKLKGFALDGLQVKVTGMANPANNKTYTVKSGDAKEPITIGANNIAFEPSDDIKETPPAFQLEEIDAGDVIYISGAYDWANNGSHLVKTPGASSLEISPGWSNAIVAGGAGFWIDIKRGNNIEVEETVANERTGANATVLAYGQGIAQRFQTGTTASWAAATVEIKVRKVGNPTDDIEIRLVTDSAGSFGTWVATAYINDTDITDDEQGRWMTASFDVNYTLSPSAWYWLGILRVGTADAENYYEVWLDGDAGYASGTLLLSDGTTYHAPAEAKNLCFRVLGAVDTALQAEEICSTIDAFDAVIIEDISGLSTCQYRDGSLFASVEMAELLDTGDGTSTRMIATVSPLRLVSIRKQPTKSAQYIWRKGALYTLQGRPVSPGLLPVGTWCALDDETLLRGAMATVSPFFIEYASYTADSGWQLRAAGEPDPWVMGGTLDG